MPWNEETVCADRTMERRARFVYEGARIAAVAAQAPIVPEPWDDREEAFRSQFVEVIERQCGPDRSTSPEELHGSWMQAYTDMGWVYGIERDPVAKTHPDMVPYDRLGLLEQDKDAVFVALCEIARQWIREPNGPGNPCQGLCEFHGQLYCKSGPGRRCEDYVAARAWDDGGGETDG